MKGVDYSMLKEKRVNNEEKEWSEYAREEVKKLSNYIPGKPINEVKKEYGLSKVIKLASNENPLGVSANVQDTIIKGCKRINRYPDGASRKLVDKIAEKLDISKDMITPGNGSDGLLKVIAETFLAKNDEVIISYPSFVEYNFVSQLMGCHITRVWTRDYQQNIKGIRDAITAKTKLIFLANPDNPTGTIMAKNKLEDLLNNMSSDVIVVIDEAYHEYVQNNNYPNGLDYVKAGYPVIVLRTLSKVYGLAGLRLGYALTTPEVKAMLMKVRDPFNVNQIAEIAGIAALNDNKFFQKTINNNESEKEYLYSELERLNLKYVPTESNFILIDTGMDSLKLFTELMKKGIIIRPGKPLGYNRHIRVSIGTHEENEEFIRAFELTLE